MKMPPLDVVGKVISGHDAGLYVKVIFDSGDTGGYYVLTSNEYDFSVGFDDWVESKEILIKYFAESDWVIDWLG
ncbi:hypothetical protein QV12_20315 [Pseudomonas putida]|uniref:hypothetical protein n=1 Tax=Pseudomonas TaxID=286 RepID=UPI0005C18A4B|nr:MULTISPECIES: hypothetical protein [Pseudomonas]KIU47102.1 hypothetical protein QV12_20315 [Pseudomonas putida]